MIRPVHLVHLFVCLSLLLQNVRRVKSIIEPVAVVTGITVHAAYTPPQGSQTPQDIGTFCLLYRFSAITRRKCGLIKALINFQDNHGRWKVSRVGNIPPGFGYRVSVLEDKYSCDGCFLVEIHCASGSEMGV